MALLKIIGGFLAGLGISWGINKTGNNLMLFLPEIATIGIMLCSFGLMITADLKLWLGRIFMIFWLSVSILMG